MEDRRNVLARRVDAREHGRGRDELEGARNNPPRCRRPGRVSGMNGRGAPCRPAMPGNGTTVRAAGRERRMRATRSHAEPRTPRWRLPGAVRAHDEGGGRHYGRGAVTMAAAARAQARNRATVSRAHSL